FLKRARRVIRTKLGVSAKDWEVVVSNPTYAVLRDPNDDAFHPLTLSVSSFGADKPNLMIRYQPYDSYGKDYSRNRQGDGLDWLCGPVVVDVLSLGRAIQQHEEHDRKINASMPDHLP